MVLRLKRLARSLRRTGSGAGGFTLAEVLIAMALLAGTLVGVLPLFIRSMSNNLEGGRITDVTARSRIHLEELHALPFNSPEITVPVGETELLTTEFYSRAQDRWIGEDDFPVGEAPSFTRMTRVRQFSVTSVNNADLLFADDEALDGGAVATQVHLKEIEVRVNTGEESTENLLGGHKTVTLRLLKGF